jgi:hypothetical protein
MRKTLTLFLILISAYSIVYAGGGHAARYQIDLIDTDSEKYSGYIYINSFESDFDVDNDDFQGYVLRHIHGSVMIYKEVKSIAIRSDFNVDFTIKENIIEIAKEAITKIDFISKESFPPGMQIIKLSSDEYKTISGDPKKETFFYNDQLSENCSYNIISYSDSADITKIKDDMEAKCQELIDDNRLHDFSTYFNTLKPTLIDKRIIIFMHCSAM